MDHSSAAWVWFRGIRAAVLFPDLDGHNLQPEGNPEEGYRKLRKEPQFISALNRFKLNRTMKPFLGRVLFVPKNYGVAIQHGPLVETLRAAFLR
jgi:hypothetical protein